jgi:hypothetical protein
MGYKEMNTRIIYPGFRNGIRTAFSRFFDEERQKTWFSKTAKHRFWDSLIYYIIEPLDMQDLFDNAEEQIGVTLYNKEEAEIISKYLNFFDNTFEGDMPDSYYVNHEKWPEVIEGAKQIVDLMEKNNKKYNIQIDWDIWSRKERQERENKIGAMVDKTVGFSLKEKQSMKDLMANCSDNDFTEVSNSVIHKIMPKKER